MSCSCCCCVTPSGELLEGIRKKERLVGGEGQQEDGSRRDMDISLLREQYRCTRERQKRHTQVLLRTVSEELSEAASIIPVTQGLTSPWKPNSSSPPSLSCEPDHLTYDPWHIHLGLHRRCCPGVSAQLTASSPETTNTNSSSRRSSSSSEAVTWQQDVDSASRSPTEEDYFRGDPDPGSSERTRGDPEKMDPVHVCVSGSLEVSEDLPDGSFSDCQCSAAGSDESSTPVASITCSPSNSSTSLHEDLKENQSAGRNTDNSVPQNGSSSARTGSRKFSAPVLRFTRQLSVGGVGSSGGVHQGHIYQPFPNRKAPRISEAARRLGMYSSF